jgi:hypothetical protein
VGTVTPLRFRPTVVVCLGEEGQAVGSQLAVLLPNLDPARRAGVALLAVNEGTIDSHGHPVGRWFDPGLGAVTGEVSYTDEPETTPLPTLVVEALRGQDPRQVPAGQTPRRGVLDDSVVWRIKDAGYAVPKAMAVVWVAAPTHTPWLECVIESINAALRSEGVDGWVVLALTTVYPRDPSQHARQAAQCGQQPWGKFLLQPEAKAATTFAYIFESHDEKGTFWEGLDDVPFAAAEAIFVLTATGITTTGEYQETLRRSMPGMVKEPYERIGSIGTSRLTFPRAQAEQYCASRLGAALMREWAPGMAGQLDQSDAGEAKTAADAFLAQTLRRIGDDRSAAMLRGGRPSPRLSAEAIGLARGLSRPAPDDGFIFAHFGWREIERMAGRTGDVPDALLLQDAKAEEGFGLWKETIRPGWERHGLETARNLTQGANGLVLQGASGVAHARAYAEELNRLLTVEQERQAKGRESRELRYRRFLATMDGIASGEWEDEAAQAEYADAAVTATPHGQIPSQPPNAATSGQQADGMEVDAEAEAPPTREEAVVARLAVRSRWFRRRVPPIPALVGAGLLIAPPATLLGQVILPGAWFTNAIGLPLLALFVVLLTALGAFAFFRYRQREAEKAEADLRQVYRRKWAQRCEQYEDKRRVALLLGVQNRIRRMLERLADWEAFMRQLAERMEQDATTIEHQLFDGATGRRDVLIANRQRLRKHEYNLELFEWDVGERRRVSPVAGCEWHANQAEMLFHLRDAIGDHLSLVDADEGEIVQPIREFCLSIVRPYLTGDLVDLGAALEAMPVEQSSGLFDTLVDRSAILYHPANPPRSPSVFVAARDEFRVTISQNNSSAAAPILLRIDDREWLATVRLLPGGAEPAFWDRDAAIADQLVIPPAPIWTVPA